MELLVMLDINFDCLQIQECQFLKYTGLYCPWCGGTRAVMALLKGNLIESLYYHTIVIYVVLIGFLFMVRRVISYLCPFKTKKYYSNTYIFLGFVVVLVNWLIKNIMLHMYKIMIK